MTPSDIAPKRLERPQVLVAYVMHLIGSSLGLRGDRLRELQKMTIAFVEAGDLYDDAVDGDYAAGHLHHLLAVSSCLHFVATRCALRFGTDIADSWLEAMHELPKALLLEKDGDGSLSSYMEAVGSQAALFSALGRVAAQAAGATVEQTRHVVELTRLLYAYLQYPQDLREAPVEVGDGSSMTANIMGHLGIDQLRLLFGQLHQQMQSALATLPDNRDTAHLRALLASMRPA